MNNWVMIFIEHLMQLWIFMTSVNCAENEHGQYRTSDYEVACDIGIECLRWITISGANYEFIVS